MDAHQYVHVDVPSGYFFYWMFYYKHHSYMDAHQYVHADVPSGYFFYWMFYYTHRSDTVALQYLHIDVPSDHLCPWMFYDTHHMDMDVPEYVSPIKKKKGRNITLLRDKRNYEMWVTNQFHKNSLTRHVFFIKFL